MSRGGQQNIPRPGGARPGEANHWLPLPEPSRLTLERAMSYIRKALEEGFKEKKKFIEEPEFANLQALPEFQHLKHPDAASHSDLGAWRQDAEGRP